MEKSYITNLIKDEVIYEYTKIIARHAFEFMNGRINPTIRARGIKFSLERDIDIGINQIVSGSSVTGIVYVNIDCLKEVNNALIRKGSKGLSESKALGFVVGVIAHELSHCEQNISMFMSLENDKTQVHKMFDEFNDVESGKKNEIDIPTRIEIANELHTIEWLDAHFDEIKKEFPGIDLSYYKLTSSYLLLNEKCNNPVKLSDYHTFKSPYQAFLSLLSSVMGINNIEKLIELFNEQGIHNFYMIHDINKVHGGKNRVNMYWLGSIKSLEQSDSICDALIDTILEEIILPQPFFTSGYAMHEDTSGTTVSFIMLSMNGKHVYGNSKFPDNISTLFKAIRTIPSWFTKDMESTLIKPYYAMDMYDD